jgi:glycosyltransferase involved in cell wall biosynthesis
MTTGATLGICIPTYKRPDQLEACIRSIIASAGGRPIPIVVADDSADDTNADVIRRLQAEYPALRHERNPANLGIDRNILRSVDVCPADYAWIMGEDDRMQPAGIPKVLAFLESSESAGVPFVYVNYASVNEDFTRELRDRSLPLRRDGWQDGEAFLRSQAWSMGFIGACVVRKASWAEVKPDPYIGTFFAHVGVILAMLHRRRLWMISEPLVLNRCSSPDAFTWKQVTFEVLGGWSRLMDRLAPLYGEDACLESRAAFVRAHGLSSLKFLCYIRSGGALDMDVYRRHIRPGPHGWLYKLAARCIAVTDPRVFRWAQRILHRRARRRVE